MNDPQSIAALVIVGLTLAIFAYKLLSKKSGSCGGGCACTMKPKTPQKEDTKTPE